MRSKQIKLSIFSRQLVVLTVLFISFAFSFSSVGAQTETNVTNAELYQQIIVLQERVKELTLQLQKERGLLSEVQKDDSLHLQEFRSYLQKISSDDSDDKTTGRVKAAEEFCISEDKEYSEGDTLRTVTVDDSTVRIDNGRVVCRDGNWKPYRCLSTSCSVNIVEPNSNWCELGGLSIPNRLTVTVSNDFKEHPEYSKYFSVPANKFQCYQGNIQPIPTYTPGR